MLGSLFQKFLSLPPVDTLIGWFDSYKLTMEGQAKKEGDDEIDWIRTIPFFSLHILCLLVIFVGVSWVAVATAAFLYFIRMFAITGFYHRYFSHKTFKTSRAFQFVMAVWGNTATQRGALWWASHHRRHHAHSDQPGDVHSPIIHSFMWSHLFWITTRTNHISKLSTIPDIAKYPELVFLDRFDSLVPAIFAFLVTLWGVALNYFFPELGTSGFQMFVWGFLISTVCLFHGTSTINSLSHLFGTRRFKTTDQSRNNPILAIITLGEGWHNNHHYYCASARQGFYWWEYDITYYGLKTLSMFGLIWDMLPVPEHIKSPANPAMIGFPAKGRDETKVIAASPAVMEAGE